MAQPRETFLTRAGTPSYRTPLEARALGAWRGAEELVRERWKEYLGARGDTRKAAFGAYATALEAEAAGAELELTRRGAAA